MERLEVWLHELYKTKSTFFHTLTQLDYDPTRYQLTPPAHVTYCKYTARRDQLLYVFILLFSPVFKCVRREIETSKIVSRGASSAERLFNTIKSALQTIHGHGNPLIKKNASC